MLSITTADIAVLSLVILTVTMLSSSVGQGGGSGYLAAMALFGVAPEVMKRMALRLNIAVTALTTTRYAQAGHFSWRFFCPFMASSVPLAFLGGTVPLQGSFYGPIVGLLLCFAAYRLLHRRSHEMKTAAEPVPLALAMLSGATIGFVSGLTGIGGGIFLSPLLLIMGWAEPRRSAATSSAFILVNSLAGILGYFARTLSLPQAISVQTFAVWSCAAIVGSLIGADLGSRHLTNLALQRLLASLLVIAGTKLMLV
jgi:uncharacterized membrane protein YfcA